MSGTLSSFACKGNALWEGVGPNSKSSSRNHSWPAPTAGGVVSKKRLILTPKYKSLGSDGGGGRATLHLKWDASEHRTLDSGPQPYLHPSRYLKQVLRLPWRRRRDYQGGVLLSNAKQSFTSNSPQLTARNRASAKKKKSLHPLEDISPGSPKAGYSGY